MTPTAQNVNASPYPFLINFPEITGKALIFGNRKASQLPCQTHTNRKLGWWARAQKHLYPDSCYSYQSFMSPKVFLPVSGFLFGVVSQTLKQEWCWNALLKASKHLFWIPITLGLLHPHSFPCTSQKLYNLARFCLKDINVHFII